ncbi:MAG TPA: isoprenylcysteine carboxylmethyltransferase family protein [Burkholderiales bacterium]|nr:isoprenylcysteine carboxylmethyltransferase family protein [Burkholderiales bacterium]
MRGLEHRIPPPLVGLIVAAAMYGIHEVAAPMRFAFQGHVVLALVIGAAALAVDISGVVAFLRARTTVNPLRPDKASTLVTGGIFRRTRNPMYLGMAMLLVGWAVYLANPLTLLGIPAFVAYLNRFQIAPEERALEQRFGADYRGYRARVRRWL